MSITKSRKIILGVLVGTIALAGGYYWYYQTNKDVIAKVGSLKITQSEFEHEMRVRGGKFVSSLDKKALLDEMIRHKLMLNKAYQQNIHQREDVQRSFEYTLIGKVKKQFVDKKKDMLKIKEEMVEEYYRTNKDEFFKPGQDRLAILLLKKQMVLGAAEKYAELKVRLTEVIENVDELPAAKDGFGHLAISHSEHQVSRYKGGEVGWFSQQGASYWEPEVLKAGFSIKKEGDISPIVETEKGFYLVRLMERKLGEHRSFDSVKNTIYHRLVLENQKAIKDNFRKTLQGEFPVTIRYEKLDAIKKTSRYVKGDNEALPFSMGLMN